MGHTKDSAVRKGPIMFFDNLENSTRKMEPDHSVSPPDLEEAVQKLNIYFSQQREHQKEATQSSLT